MLTLLHNDALTALQPLDAESVQCVVTSPPYWGLRDYGLKPVVCFGERICNLVKHCWDTPIPGSNRGGSGTPTNKNNRGEGYGRDSERGRFCLQCRAWRGCLGLEPTPELYVRHIVQIFREVKRVLRKDGTLWLNLGDSYAGSWGNYGGQNRGNGKQREITSGSKAPQKSYDGLEAWKPPTANSINGLKPKDLVGIPWMVAFALRADGWYLRSDIIWSKPNPMPESVTDRPTKAHEYIFLLAKSQKYYYDASAIAEPLAAPEKQGRSHTISLAYSQDSGRAGDSGLTNIIPLDNRNKRSVWNVATQSFPDAHFATFPPALITPCILAGSKAGDTVLDPFAGSGTTGKVAIELGRKAILIEPKAEYVEMIERRCKTTIGLPLSVEA